MSKFNKGPEKVVEEFKLRVVYIPANPPSPVPEEAEEDLTPRSSVGEDEAHHPSLFDVALVLTSLAFSCHSFL
jgi:hypothetical protein